MAGRRTSLRHAESIDAGSIAGATLVGLGTLFLYQNLAGVVVRLRHILGADGSDVLGVPLAAIQMVVQVLQAYTTDHRGFLLGVLQQMLVTSWPLLLVAVGTVLLRNSSTDSVNLPQKR